MKRALLNTLSKNMGALENALKKTQISQTILPGKLKNISQQIFRFIRNCSSQFLPTTPINRTLNFPQCEVKHGKSSRSFQERRNVNKLLNTYAKSGKMGDARQLFDKMSTKDVASYSIMVSGYAKNGLWDESFKVFIEMVSQSYVKPNEFTLSSLISACPDFSRGKQIHALVVKHGLDSSVFVGNSLVTMYVRNEAMGDALFMFDEIPQRDLISWNALKVGFSQNGDPEEALGFLVRMLRDGAQPNHWTLSSAVGDCAYLADIGTGLQIHCHALKSGLALEVSVATSLVDMYSKCMDMPNAAKVFESVPEKNLISWSAMISGYVKNDMGNEASEAFRQMQESGLGFNEFTLSSVLSACGNLMEIEKGKQVHSYMVKTGFECYGALRAALITMYAKNDACIDAYNIFEDSINPDIILWTSLISGYVLNGFEEEAAEMFYLMHSLGVSPNELTFATILAACASRIEIHVLGKQIHALALKSDYDSAESVGTSLMSMYAKCGDVDDAKSVFDRIPEKDVACWNSMIGGLAQHGRGLEALEGFNKMLDMDMSPNHATFIGVFSACSHVGMAEKGLEIFNSMTRDYGIVPDLEHYACVVDLIGRAGKLQEALEFISNMPIKADAMVWRAFLGSCRVHGDIELGKLAASHIIELEPHDSAAYVLLSNMYNASGLWNDGALLRECMDDRGAKKEAGCSWITVNGEMHSFVSNDLSHPLISEIHWVLEQLYGRMKDIGYMPNIDFVLHDVEKEQREYLICYHSEKLAIAYGLICTSPGMPLQIIKNLRVCGDCHNATKFISKVAKREIVVRDSNRFHHFKGGICSCGDFW